MCLLSTSQVQLNLKTYHWSLKMCLVPLVACAAHPNRSASRRRQSMSRKKQVMLVTSVIPTRIHPQHNIIIIIKQFTIITHKITFTIITITIIFILVISMQRIMIICITQTLRPPTIIKRTTKFLIAVFLPLQVQALVQTVETWVSSVHISHPISPSCRVRCLHLRHQA